MAKVRASKKLGDTRQGVLGIQVDVVETGPEQSASGKVAFVHGEPRFKMVFNGVLWADHLKAMDLGWILAIWNFVGGLSIVTTMETAYRSGGRPPYHPRWMLALILYCVREGCTSLRDIERMAIRDIGAMWLCGGIHPDFTTIAKFLALHQKVLTEELLTSTMTELNRLLGRKRGKTAVDGTVIEAAASRLSAVRKEAVEQHLVESLANLAEAQATQGDEEEVKAAEEKVERAATALGTLEQRIAARAARGKLADRLRISVGEPEAVVQPTKSDTVRPSYKPILMVAEDKLIEAVTVVPSHESAGLPTLLDDYEQVHGGPPTAVTADTAFFNEATLAMAVERDLNLLVNPKGGMDEPDACDKPAPTTSAEKPKLFERSRFTYDPAEDVVVCPAGKKLTAKHRGKYRHGVEFQVYGTSGCTGCELKSQCTTGRYRIIKRSAGDELKDAMREVLKSPQARRDYQQRQVLVEPVIGELKRLTGLTRFRRRGLAGALLETIIHCTALNLRRAFSRVGVVVVLLISLFSRRWTFWRANLARQSQLVPTI